VDEIVLDLRHNKGGNIEEGLSTASLFLPSETNVALLMDINGTQWKRVSKTASDGVTEVPTVVLVDGSTASAAEMVSATLQDNCRAILVGRRTFGKARVQGVFSLSDGSGLSLTIGAFKSPSMRDFHGVGIKPDIESELPAEWIIPSLEQVQAARHPSCRMMQH